ncbi:S1C family serine protease [Elusimicrobium minutum]|uniref:S1C family serine protease n=1 Tax=Elusimicrobium minutum TaxID=423605 RepID=UPI0001617F9F|nr:trypsin-like peptidase domain-containing protein [Elusimicrobium minutum]
MKLKLFLLFIIAFSLCDAKTHVEIAEEFSPSVVTINVANSRGGTFNGTGFIVSPDGLIATSRHVVDGAIYMNVTFNTGLVSDEAVLIAVSPKVDIALIKINAKDLPTVVLGDSDYALPGSIITVIGNPRRLQNTVTEGIISQVRLMKKGVVWHQISAPISPSSSGSPVFNENGEVISVAFSTYKGADNQNLNFAIPSNYLAELMLEKGYIPPMAQRVQTNENKFASYIKQCWDTLIKLIS